MGATEDSARGEQRGPATQTVLRQTLLAGDLDPDVGVHRLPNLQVKLDLAPLVLGVPCVGATDDQPLAVIGNGEARTVEMLPQFGYRRRVEQSKSHQPQI
jgi:hypothetical protein